MKKLIKNLFVLLLVITAFTACSDDSDENTTKATVKLTDAPFPFNFVAEANVGVAKIELKDASGEYVTVFEGSTSYNMVGLTNGETETVVSASIEPGTYAIARVTLNSASVELTDGTNYEMNADASTSYEVAISPSFVVEEGEESELLLDLDINESFSFQGTWIGPWNWISNIADITGCQFQAHFRACDLDQTGEIHGTVNNGLTGEYEVGAYVVLDMNGEEITTQTEADGSFVFIGVAEGSYDIEVETSESFDGEVHNVQVSAGATATCSVTTE